MNITKEGQDMFYLKEALKFDRFKATELLRHSLNFINEVPNKKYTVNPPYKDSYELASKINEFLKTLEE